ncbi:hypothetical protein GLOTRDRAFT_36948, partial [Gloeophyllum trabeum ATCC 11539]
LTVGPANGAIGELFAKIKSINDKHGPFDLAICTGDFFGPPRPKEQAADWKSPLECLVMQGEHALPERVIEKVQKSGGTVTKNVFILQKYGVMTTANGLRIACLGGTYDALQYGSTELPQDFTCPYFTKTTVDKLLTNTNNASSKTQNYSSVGAIKSSQLIDIFVTNVWPSTITRFSSVPLPSPELASIGAPPVDEIVRATKPRYVFSAGGGRPPKFWEREPFLWEGEEGRSTRFISLGAFGAEAVNGKKQRWFYAFSISPPSSEGQAPAKPANTTANPFAEARPPKRPIDDSEPENFIWGNKPRPGYKCRKCDSTEHYIQDCPERDKPPEGYICNRCKEPGHYVRDCPTKHQLGDTGGRKPREGYVCRACASTEHYIDDCPVAKAGPKEVSRRGKKGPPKEITADECWFCLSNPNVAKHLIVSIGAECYVTLPKGQIIPTHTAQNYSNVPNIPGGGHVLIIPIAHYPTFSSIAPELRGPVLAETERYKSALRSVYSKYGAGAVFVEIARLGPKGGHAHIQAVPVPVSLQDGVEDAFIREGKSQKIEFESDPEGALKAISEDHNRSYFRVDLPDGRKMVHLIQNNIPFSIQFGRQVLVNLMGIPDRYDWKTCAQSEDEDKSDADAFKTAFAEFDPTL